MQRNRITILFLGIQSCFPGWRTQSHCITIGLQLRQKACCNYLFYRYYAPCASVLASAKLRRSKVKLQRHADGAGFFFKGLRDCHHSRFRICALYAIIINTSRILDACQVEIPRRGIILVAFSINTRAALHLLIIQEILTVHATQLNHNLFSYPFNHISQSVAYKVCWLFTFLEFD